MEPNYEYPTTRELRSINPLKIQNLTRNRPTFSIFPLTDTNAWDLEWSQKDNSRGLQQLRGLNGEPSYVKMVGEKRFSAKPGVFGEYMTLDEEMLTKRAVEAGYNAPSVDVSDLVLERQDYLNARELDVIEYIHWKVLLDGQFSFVGPTGAEYGDQFGINQATFSDWSNTATATPLADFMALKQAMVGTSTGFGSKATAYMNSTTLQYLLQNKNANDLGGQLALVTGGIKPLKTSEEINSVLTAMGLPNIVEYDEGFHTEPNGVFQRWIPTDKIAIVGYRANGDTIGEYRMVRNANNPDMAAGRYEKVVDDPNRVPRLIEVHRGHNGGPVLFYPSAIVSASC